MFEENSPSFIPHQVVRRQTDQRKPRLGREAHSKSLMLKHDGRQAVHRGPEEAAFQMRCHVNAVAQRIVPRGPQHDSES